MNKDQQTSVRIFTDCLIIHFYFILEAITSGIPDGRQRVFLQEARVWGCSLLCPGTRKRANIRTGAQDKSVEGTTHRRKGKGRERLQHTETCPDHSGVAASGERVGTGPNVINRLIRAELRVAQWRTNPDVRFNQGKERKPWDRKRVGWRMSSFKH